ncbi:hypothetical protein EXIGLDRAFT_720787 [Exidia glandulosa HHB12029]|uniref:Cytochrome b mRNA-processing protein 4 n=1 Tax=Exidia glandulosa HHB12029 TaxID=1314781 RepID=A0A165G4A2_EXIGL|nr:hypothetical protein EXIGLDRAFT_720787 [Exidia glandulosa HHB12029]
MPPARKPRLGLPALLHRGLILGLFGTTAYGLAILFYFQPRDMIQRGRGLAENVPELQRRIAENERKATMVDTEVMLARMAQDAVPSHRQRRDAQ